MVITTDGGACHTMFVVSLGSLLLQFTSKKSMFVVSLGSLLLQFTSKKIHGGDVVKVLP
jgi:hypothetical protein